MNTKEKILGKHTDETGIYLTHGMVRGSDSLDAMEEYATIKCIEVLEKVFYVSLSGDGYDVREQIQYEITELKALLNTHNNTP